MRNNPEIVVFEPWMTKQIAELSVLLYGGEVERKTEYYEHLLCEDFSLKHPPIALVGLSKSRRVVASQFYFYWPFRRRGTVYNSYQSGSSMVHPDFRGQKVFQKMLSLGSSIGQQRKVDFFIGFPVRMSYGAFMKDGWTDIGSLRWWSKVLNPLRLFNQKYRKRAYDSACFGEPLDTRMIAGYSAVPKSEIHLDNNEEFLEWRYFKRNRHMYRQYENHSDKVLVVFKLSEQHGFSEIIIGESFIGDHDTSRFGKKLKTFCDTAKDTSKVQAISFALLSPSNSQMRGMILNGFIPNKVVTPLVFKPISTDAPVKKDEWDISLRDTDTW